MKYVIPNDAIKAFKKSLDLTIKCFDLMQDILKKNINLLELTYTGSLKEDAVLEIQSHYLDLVKLTINNLKNLRQDVSRINSKFCTS